MVWYLKHNCHCVSVNSITKFNNFYMCNAAMLEIHIINFQKLVRFYRYGSDRIRYPAVTMHVLRLRAWKPSATLCPEFSNWTRSFCKKATLTKGQTIWLLLCRSWEDEVLSLASTPSVPDMPRYVLEFNYAGQLAGFIIYWRVDNKSHLDIYLA